MFERDVIENDGTKRRTILRSLGGALAVGVAAESAAASSNDEVEVNVGYSSASGRRAARDAASEVRREFNFDALTARMPRERAERLRDRSDIRYVEENGQMHALAQTTPWGIERVGAPAAHDAGETGAGAHVAIIDTGIDSDHEDLVANLGEGKAFVNARGPYAEDWDDDNGHGTHCAGTADAVDNDLGVVGVSTEATLHAVKVLDNSGSGTFSDVAAGIEYTADQGWDVGSLSLGSSSGSQTVKDACVYAYGKGVFLSAAAGNSGPCTDCVGYPAAYEECVAVSATDASDALASFSSTGPEVELAGPGVDVLSTVPGGYDTYNGTSMACPHVSGAAAQLMANGYTNTEARSRLQETAEDIGLSSTEQGHGLLDVDAALGHDGGGSDGGVAVSTHAASGVDETSATLNGELTDLGSAASADCYFEWRAVGADAWNATGGETLTSTGTFSDTVIDLESGTDYEFRAVAETSDGDSDVGSILAFTTNSGDGGSAPVIDQFVVTDTSNPAWERYEVDWTISDADGDLASVTTELLDGETVVDSASSNVGGGEASGTHEVRTRGSADAVRLVVVDELGHETAETKSV